MNQTFLARLTLWAGGLAMLHSGLRALSGTGAPASFLGDLTFFASAMLALAALPAGIAASRHLSWNASGPLVRLAAIAGVAAGMALVSYGIADQVAPRVWAGSADVDALAEPAAMTSSQLRSAARDRVMAARDLEARGAPASAEWQEVNRLAFAHELRIVQALLLPIMGLIGVLAGIRARSLTKPWGSAALWGLGLYLVLSMFMAGENGYELIVLRSSGPMAFVAWLQAVVPGSVLVGLAFASLPDFISRPAATVAAG